MIFPLHCYGIRYVWTFSFNESNSDFKKFLSASTVSVKYTVSFWWLFSLSSLSILSNGPFNKSKVFVDVNTIMQITSYLLVTVYKPVKVGKLLMQYSILCWTCDYGPPLTMFQKVYQRNKCFHVLHMHKDKVRSRRDLSRILHKIIERRKSIKRSNMWLEWRSFTLVLTYRNQVHLLLFILTFVMYFW